jgi:hypothetical protein
LNFGLYCFLVVVIDLSVVNDSRRNLSLLPGLNSGDHYRLLWNVDWSLGNNRIHCSAGASLQATGLALEMGGRRRLPQSGLVHGRMRGLRDSGGKASLGWSGQTSANAVWGEFRAPAVR